MIYVGIVGSRERSEKKTIKMIISKFKKRYGEELTIVSGGASGIDDEVEETADELNVKTRIFKPNYDEYDEKGNDIYFERNEKIAKLSDCLIAFPKGNKGGTMNTIRHFKNLGKSSRLMVILL